MNTSNTAAQIALEFAADCRRTHSKPEAASYEDLKTFCAHRWQEEDMRGAFYLLTGETVE